MDDPFMELPIMCTRLGEYISHSPTAHGTRVHVCKIVLCRESTQPMNRSALSYARVQRTPQCTDAVHVTHYAMGKLVICKLQTYVSVTVCTVRL